ncbi:CMRF35-like molecule 9 isoform X2 [Tupaia chinensis]|uniref:CMRF35-like molecule 9 isoform X2 n=1 Tax=Tupaia chinensis TaxID=246437 RepID=UPI0003C92049|nr:CMRF35-like molecule 9 isoform X2 [Tupaia chinensis]
MWPLVVLWGCLVLPGYEALEGPKEVSGFEGDTVSLRCTYSEELREHRKYWCKKGGLLISRCSTTVYAGADGQRTTRGRVSILDSRSELAFTVTLRNLTLQDAGDYWCGVNRLGRDESFLVSLFVFPGPCCPSSSTPSSWPLATKSLQPKASTGQIRPPELTSPGLRLTLATATQAKTGAEASWFTETSPHGRTGAFLYTETSPYAENSPHTETFPHAGSSRPAMQLDSSSTRDISSAPSSSSSKPSSRASIQMVRKVAPVLVLLILLLATVLITCGSHMVRRRREAQLATEGQRDGKVYLSALTTGEEDAPSQDPNGDAGPVPPIYMSEEDLDFSKFVSV